MYVLIFLKYKNLNQDFLSRRQPLRSDTNFAPPLHKQQQTKLNQFHLFFVTKIKLKNGCAWVALRIAIPCKRKQNSFGKMEGGI